MSYAKRIETLKKRLEKATNPKTIKHLYSIINHLEKLKNWGVVK
jgi:hypothetical protein